MRDDWPPVIKRKRKSTIDEFLIGEAGETNG